MARPGAGRGGEKAFRRAKINGTYVPTRMRTVDRAAAGPLATGTARRAKAWLSLERWLAE